MRQLFVQHIFEKLLCEETWFKTGVRDKLQFIPIHQVFVKQCVLLYLGSMLSLGATLLVVSVERIKRDFGHHVAKYITPKSTKIAGQR